MQPLWNLTLICYSSLVNLEAMREAVFQHRPEFGELVQTWKDKTLLEYYAQDFTCPETPSRDILETIEKEVTTILGEKVAKNTRKRLLKQAWINTADHHGLLHHPYFHTTALALSHENYRSDTEVTVTLPFGGVSLGNDSFPRGFAFHDNEVALQKVFFKSLKYRRLPISALEPMTVEELKSEQKRATYLSLSPSATERLQSLFKALLDDSQVWSQESYSAQLTAMNNVLWHQLFSDERGDLVYLEVDCVVRQLLLNKHLITETPIYRLIFDRDWREKFVELFYGIQGSHDIESGTHLFWYIDQTTLTRQRLIIAGDTLVTPNKEIVIPLTPDAIIEGVENKTLLPSSALTLVLVQEVENLTCGGGSSQIQYLTAYAKAWAKLLGHFGQIDSGTKAKIWSGECNLFSITNKKGAQVNQATLIDILLYEDGRQEKIDDHLQSTKFSTVINNMIPAQYKLYLRETGEADIPFSGPTILIK